MRRAVLVVAVVLAGAVTAAGQVTAPKPTSAGGRPDGGFTPFRYRGFSGEEFQAFALEQPDCPLQLAVQRVALEPSGVLLTLKLDNPTDGVTERQVVGMWVMAKDGTIRGYQRHEAKHSIAAGAARSLDVTLRTATTTVLPGDVVVVAVQESMGARPWRRDTKALEQDARALVVR